MSSKRPCSVRGCSNRINAHELCTTHERRLKLGQPLEGSLFWYRFDRNIQKQPDGCWQWIGQMSVQGYGRYDNEYAHRLSYQRHHGQPVPEGMHTDHLCRNKGCVNPNHLEAVTPRINMLRGMAPGAIVWRTNICCRGHEYTPENTYWRPDGRGRQCRECIRIRWQRQAARRRAAA